MAYGRRRGRGRRTFNNFRRKRRSFTRRRRTFRRGGRKRASARRAVRKVNAEWKKVDIAFDASAVHSNSALFEQNITNQGYYCTPAPHPTIEQGTSLRQRIGNKLSRMIWKMRWSFSITQVGAFVAVGPPAAPDALQTYHLNLTAYLRVIVYQFKRGTGSINPYTSDGYHPVNFASTAIQANIEWANWSNTLSGRIFAENESFLPIHLSRFRTNIRDEIYIMHDKTYSLNTQGRANMNKRWSFRPRPYRWDEDRTLADTLAYPQNAVKILFLLQLPNNRVTGDQPTNEGLYWRLDFTSSLRFTDS